MRLFFIIIPEVKYGFEYVTHYPSTLHEKIIHLIKPLPTERLKFLKTENGSAVYNIGSGEYEFTWNQ